MDLGWSASSDPDGDAVTYDVYFEAGDSTPDVLRCNDVANTSCDPGALNPGTHYYWQVITRDEHGAKRTGPVWEFSTGSTVFFDDFSDSDSGWPTGASENCEFGYYDGHYRVRVTDYGQRCIISNPNVPPQVNGTFSVRVRRVSEENRPMLYGLIFGAGPDPIKNRWALEIYPNDDPNCSNTPFYWLYAFVNGERRYFRDRCTNVINKGEGDWNELKVTRNGENIDISINGQHKGNYSDADYLLSEGYSLLGVVSASSDTIEVEFDDFKVLSSTDIVSF